MGKKRVAAVIPARMGASRFPGKPLAPISGMPMIEHVRRRVLLSEAMDEVIVATCDQEIFDVVVKYGGKAIMTRSDHERCTDRVDEACDSINADIVVQVQGDEPLFEPEVLADLVKPMLDDASVVCTNLITVIHDKADLDDVDIVKTALNENGGVMFFSRSPIPHIRVDNGCPMYRQTGVSAFSREFLRTFSQLAPTALEATESVDFLRILGHGYPIAGVVHDVVSQGVDRPEDIAKVEAQLASDSKQNELFKRIMNNG